MATLGYDPRRGSYRVWWHEGTARRSRVVARLPKGTPRPRKDPPEALRALAEAEERELATRADRPADPGRTVGRFLDSYRAHYAGVARRAARSVEEFDRARSLLGAAAEAVPLAGFGRAHAVAHLDRLTAAGLSPRTIRQRVALLSGAWRRAVRRGEVAANPWRDLDLPDLPEPDRPSWTPEEFARLAAAARPWLRDVLAAGVHTGLRVGELIAMPWAWVEWADGGRLGSIRIPPEAAKSGRSRRVPLHPAAHDLLALRFARDGDDGGPVFRGQAGRPIGTRHQVNHAIRASCRRAGLPEVASHAMRRSFGRWAVLGLGPWRGRPVPVYVVSQVLGHADLRTTTSYLALDDVAADDWLAGPDQADWRP